MVLGIETRKTLIKNYANLISNSKIFICGCWFHFDCLKKCFIWNRIKLSNNNGAKHLVYIKRFHLTTYELFLRAIWPTTTNHCIISTNQQTRNVAKSMHFNFALKLSNNRAQFILTRLSKRDAMRKNNRTRSDYAEYYQLTSSKRQMSLRDFSFLLSQASD